MLPGQRGFSATLSRGAYQVQGPGGVPQKEEQFWTACLQGNLPVVQQLSAQVDVNWTNPNCDDQTGLYAACKEARKGVVQFLLTLPHVDVNKESAAGFTPLSRSCLGGHEEIVELLIKGGKPLSTATRVTYGECAGLNAAEIARKRGSVFLAKLVEEYSSDAGLGSKGVSPGKGRVPSRPPSEFGGRSKVLLDEDGHHKDARLSGKPPNAMNASFWKACSEQDLEAAQGLASQADVNWTNPEEDNSTPLQSACASGAPDVVDFLLSLPAINAGIADPLGWTPLSIACFYGEEEIVSKLLAHRRDIDPKKRTGGGAACPRMTAAQIAEQQGHRRIADAVGQYAEKQEGFWSAALENKLDKVRRLSPEVDVNWRNPDAGGQTALYIACREGWEPVVQFLLSLPEIDVNRESDTGWTPLSRVCLSGNQAILKAILACGKEVDTRRRIGRSSPSFANCTAAEVARQEFALPLAQLVEAYSEDGHAVTARLRKELGLVDLNQAVPPARLGTISRRREVIPALQGSPATPSDARGPPGEKATTRTTLPPPLRREIPTRRSVHPSLLPGKVNQLPEATLKSTQAIEYDFFISYRQSADKSLAKELYHILRTHQIAGRPVIPFLDARCLKAGESWEEGFTSALKRSRVFLPIISSRGVESIKSPKPEQQDNVLMEYEMALAERESRKMLVLPIFAGQLEGDGSIKPFNDFNSQIYSGDYSKTCNERPIRETMKKLLELQGFKLVNPDEASDVDNLVREVVQRAQASLQS